MNLQQDLVSDLRKQDCRVLELPSIDAIASNGTMASLNGEEHGLVVDVDRAGSARIPREIRKLKFAGPIVGVSRQERDSQAPADVEAEVAFMHAGGDRLLRSPLSGRIVKEVVRTIYRRIESTIKRSESAAAESTREFYNRRFRMHLERRAATLDGMEIKFTVGEFDILWELAERPGTVFSREQLCKILEIGFETGERQVDSHVKRIRRKVQRVKADEDILDTIYGLGYKVKI
ncbi:response regulator transcription factor [Candidatus Kaiserbacteria bacterium]|nr:response regulator transcription factor [Candidatus Kaiserbacteria bacterium]